MTQFYYLMFECYNFLTHQFNIWGFSFSIYNVTLFVMLFDTCINMLNGLFGVDKDGN